MRCRRHFAHWRPPPRPVRASCCIRAISLTRDKLSTVPIISNQMLAILIRRNSELQRAAVTDRDVLIDPALANASSFDFERFADSIDTGVAAARAAAPSLARLALPSPQYQAYVDQRARTRTEPRPVS